MSGRDYRCAWYTPAWAAEAIVERYFPDLSRNDLVVEPTCGHGVFLNAIPTAVPALGVEIDAEAADVARHITGRHIITGDFRSVPLAVRPTLILGNPPFVSEIVGDVLRRSLELLQPEGEAAFILPAYILQTPSWVVRWAQRFSLSADLLPRTLFKSLSKPLVFARFRKTERRVMVGLALYAEAYDIERMPKAVRDTLARPSPRGSAWFEVCDQVLASLGGEADLQVIYQHVAPKRPSQNPYWREKVRQTLQRRFTRTARARYARTAEAA
jgi:site-specific DNA-methyltransferase (adenine-specific)